MSRALRGEKVSRMEAIVQRDGRPDLWLEASSVPLHSASGSLTGALVVFSDVTRERMYLETMERVLGSNNKTIIDTGPQGGPGVVRGCRELRDRRRASSAWPRTGGIR